ncbi:MAG: hypothetical protein CH6_1085 [Candidatus Kapaibacterium sp.]|nr:MAG: hypothetical protein CH6_1085 [Candidatus Kapabacteria bacterium]
MKQNSHRLEPTYKELKLLILKPNVNFAGRLEPTYKELKQTQLIANHHPPRQIRAYL